MISQKTILTIKVGERSYEFHCEPTSPLGEIHDSLAQMKQYVVDRIIDGQAKEPKTKES